MTTLAKFIQAAADWNKIRYEQKFDLNLTLALIEEEVSEFKVAKDLVEQVDALCDICFIAAGALWKLGYPFEEKTFTSFFNLYQQMDVHFTDTLLNVKSTMLNFPGAYIYVCSLHQVLATTFDSLSYKLGSQDSAIKALFIIAESNNTKTAKVIPIDAKYSKDGKGDSYVAPTAALTQLVGNIANEIKH